MDLWSYKTCGQSSKCVIAKQITCTNPSSFLLEISSCFLLSSDFLSWQLIADSLWFSSMMSSCQNTGGRMPSEQLPAAKTVRDVSRRKLGEVEGERCETGGEESRTPGRSAPQSPPHLPTQQQWRHSVISLYVLTFAISASHTRATHIRCLHSIKQKRGTTAWYRILWQFECTVIIFLQWILSWQTPPSLKQTGITLLLKILYGEIRKKQVG